MRRAFLSLGLLVLTNHVEAAEDAPPPPRVATVVLCDTTPVDSGYALAIAEGYARILDPNAAPATCVTVEPDQPELPPTGFDGLLVLTFKKTELLERVVFTGELKLSTPKRGWGACGFIAQRLRIPNDDHTSATERLALHSAILPLAFNLDLIPDPFPNSPPDDLPGYDATMDLPPPTRTE